MKKKNVVYFNFLKYNIFLDSNVLNIHKTITFRKFCET